VGWGVARCLLWFAAGAAAEGAWGHVACLLGASDVHALDTRVLEAAEVHVHQERARLASSARQAMGEDAFAAAYAEGRALSLDAAVALALDQAERRSTA
jgi:hypothetical protein